MTIVPAELVDWYGRARRDLPWRAPDVTAWQILVSEFMLQQTPVARVAPIWLEWVARWPTPSATAAAGAADVLRAWGKLGYPRRAKRLHECATVIAAEHDDVVPDDVDVLLTLPGVGAYTARAVACFAYQKRVPVVDTNVRRVVARAVHGLADAASPSAVRDLADVEALLPDDSSAPVFSAALMELGATVCTARSPKCGICPLTRMRVAGGRAPARLGVRPADPALRRNRPPGARPADGRAAGQFGAGRAGTARRGVADRSRRSAIGRWTRCWSTVWWSRRRTAGSRWPAKATMQALAPTTRGRSGAGSPTG